MYTIPEFDDGTLAEPVVQNIVGSPPGNPLVPGSGIGKVRAEGRSRLCTHQAEGFSGMYTHQPSETT